MVPAGVGAGCAPGVPCDPGIQPWPPRMPGPKPAPGVKARTTVAENVPSAFFVPSAITIALTAMSESEAVVLPATWNFVVESTLIVSDPLRVFTVIVWSVADVAVTVPPAIAGWMFTSVAVNVPSAAVVPWASTWAPTVNAALVDAAPASW